MDGYPSWAVHRHVLSLYNITNEIIGMEAFERDSINMARSRDSLLQSEMRITP